MCAGGAIFSSMCSNRTIFSSICSNGAYYRVIGERVSIVVVSNSIVPESWFRIFPNTPGQTGLWVLFHENENTDDQDPQTVNAR